ncbi:hypothetical protein ACI789_10455 [Geodermatophilus sp. SYSU D00965]
MNAAPPALATRPPSPAGPTPADHELTLTALMDLFVPEDRAAAPASLRRELRSSLARLRPWLRDLVQRAALWGAGPQGAWRAW